MTTEIDTSLNNDWLVTAYWDGRSKAIPCKRVVSARTRDEAIRVAKSSFAQNASRVWAILDSQVVRHMTGATGRKYGQQ